MYSHHIRVELHNATLSDYTTLHSAMSKAGFSTSVTASDGKKYYLPTAEYVTYGQAQLSQAISAAKIAANTTGKNSTVFGVTYSAWEGNNLTPVR